MEPERDELLELFDAALALPPARRAAFVDRAAAGRAELAAELRSLLGHADRAGDFLEHPALVVPPEPSAPRQIGPYRLLERLGEGGFGEVWRAEQSAPIARTVAIKLIRPGIGSRQARDRFAAERQALALLEHPGIARIHDAGETDSGQPWYAMELVDGPSIAEFATRRRLGLADRLRLVVQVCEALHHAHERGIVHRDLKPSNVLVALVDGEPRPKIIDFGVAKLEDLDAAWRTQDGQMLGTPAYMSPEQARGEAGAVDARADVHAVGVLLFELLTGSVPFEPDGAAGRDLLALHRRIAEDEPPRPSQRIAARAAGGVTPPVLVRAVRGELDWIVTKALANRPEDRYRSARALADDLQRFLRDEPVRATPPSTGYRLRKWLRRHRAVAALAALALVAGLAGAAGTWWHRQRAVRSEREVQVEARKLAEVAAFLRRMLASADPDESPGHEVTVRQLLTDAERELAAGVDAAVECALRHTIGMSHRGLGHRLDAEHNLRIALDLADRIDAPERGEIRRDLGLLLLDDGRATEAGALIDAALELAGDDPQQRALALHARSRLAEHRADYPAAVTAGEAAIAAGGPDLDPALRVSLELQRARMLAAAARYPDSAAALDAVRERAVAMGPRGWPLLLQIDVERCEALARGADPAAARALALDLVGLAERVYGPDHFEVGFYRCRLAERFQADDRLDDAEREFRAGLAILRAARPEGSMTEAAALADLGWTLIRLGRRDEAETALRDALAAHRRLFGDAHPRVATCLRDLARVLRERGEPGEAEALCREALAIFRATHGDDHLGLAATLHALALCELALGRAPDAVAHLEEAVRIGDAVLAEGHDHRIEFRLRLAHALATAGRFEEAQSLVTALRAAIVAVGGDGDRRLSVCDAILDGIVRALGR